MICIICAIILLGIVYACMHVSSKRSNNTINSITTGGDMSNVSNITDSLLSKYGIHISALTNIPSDIPEHIRTGVTTYITDRLHESKYCIYCTSPKNEATTLYNTFPCCQRCLDFF